MPIDIEIRGLKEAQAKATQVLRDLYGGAMLNAMRKATLLVNREGKMNTPVRTGRLRASETPEIRREKENEVVGVDGSNVFYAPFVELKEFAFKGRVGPHYLQRALDDNAEKIQDIIGGAVTEIVRK